MAKDKETQELMAELSDLELDPQDIEDIIAAARMSQQSRTLPSSDDASASPVTVLVLHSSTVRPSSRQTSASDSNDWCLRNEAAIADGDIAIEVKLFSD